MIGVHTPAVFPGSFIFQAHLGWQRNQVELYENPTYDPHAACSYHVKLQRQRYMERRTTDNIYEKSQTSVRVAHARPN